MSEIIELAGPFSWDGKRIRLAALPPDFIIPIFARSTVSLTETRAFDTSVNEITKARFVRTGRLSEDRQAYVYEYKP